MDDLTQIPAAATDGCNRPDLIPLSISRFGTWAKCSALGYLRYVAKAETDFTAVHFLIGTTLHEALESYYKFEVDTPMEGVDKALKAIFEKYGEAEAFDDCCAVALEDAKIIARFEKGEFKKPDGSKYTAPRMTTAYKNLVKETGLDKKIAKLAGVGLGKVKLKEGGVVEMVARIKTLMNRYQRTIMIPRERFERLFVEGEFDFVDVAPNGKEVRWRGFMDLVGKLKPEHGGQWVLVDYKSGRAQSIEDHQHSADASLQLTMYEHVLTQKWGIPRDNLMVALHFLDAAYEAPTNREYGQYQCLLGMVPIYQEIVGKPGLIPRLFYDSKTCQDCENRSACVATFGDGVNCHTKSAPLAVPLKPTEEAVVGIWD
jgi:hypothetical protein